MKKYAIFVLLLQLAFAAGCAKVDSLIKETSNAAESKKAGTVNVPRNVKNSDPDFKMAKDSPCLVTMPNAADILFGDKKLTKDALGKEISDCLTPLSLEKKIVYIKADDALEYGNILDVLNVAQKAKVEKIGFVVSPTDNIDEPRNVLEVMLPADSKHIDSKLGRPNPLLLIVFLDDKGKIKLNMDGHDSLESLTTRLKEIFKQREETGVFREGTNEVEKTVFIKAPRSIKYGEVVKAIDAVRGGGGSPIGIQLDEFVPLEEIELPPPPKKS